MWHRLLIGWLAISLLGLSLAGPVVAAWAQSLPHEEGSLLSERLAAEMPVIEDHDCTHLCHVSAHILGLSSSLPRLSRHLLAVDRHPEPLAWLVRREDQPPPPPPCHIA